MRRTAIVTAANKMRMTRNVTNTKTTAPGPNKSVAARARNKFAAAAVRSKFRAVAAYYNYNFGAAPGRSNSLPAAARDDKTIPEPARIPIGGC